MKWQLPAFDGKAVVFIGRGREGHSFESFLQKYGKHTSFTFVDKEDDPDYLQHLINLDLSQTVIVKTPGCPGRLVPVPYTTPTNVFFELAATAGFEIIGVTGTKGKSTTASLIHHFLQSGGRQSILCGNIGQPMIDFLDTATPDTLFVLELGAYMTADLTRSPHVAVISNLFPEHLDYFGSETAYYEAKHQLLSDQTPDDVFIYNPDFPLLAEWAATATARARPIEPSDSKNIDLSNSKLIGDHNKLNVLIALAAADEYGIERETCLASLPSFEPLRHRLQVCDTIDGVRYIDDAISTTPESTMAAIAATGPVGCIFLGGLDRGYDFTELGTTIAAAQIPAVVLFPDSGAKIKASFPQGYAPHILETSSMDDAVAFGRAQAPHGSTVLLSCASPSYSLWKDFEAKGDDFQRAVAALRDR